ncbi:MAG: 1-deoxy-D-xylulose 5-phosphate reductoisomerase [Planctomycetota bacterium]|nr:MAG: 1-deoxy-D-xylulose 5-phosphate reductoisomerase [Planctomycetota bacterium]
MVKRVLVLGSTGSVGRQTLEVMEQLGGTHQVVGLSAWSSAELLFEQARQFGPEAVALGTAPVDTSGLPQGCELLTGAEGVVELVARTRPDVVLCAITGAAGLRSTLAAAETGADVALANKESMVLAGHLVRAACARSGSTLLPVDSEHSAIAQCLHGEDPAGVRRVILTASGGPFRGRTRDELAHVTIEEALKHPSWDMGPRITIDSATLMNKALEVIEAVHLFDVCAEQVHVVMHRQSVIHSMVEYCDGAILAQLSPPDMRLPIRWALGYPARVKAPGPPIDLLALSGLTFEEPDRDTFPCLALGEHAARQGGLSGTIMNAANEIAVSAFLNGQIPFLAIGELVGDALNEFEAGADPDLDTILATDSDVRRHTTNKLTEFSHPAGSPHS